MDIKEDEVNSPEADTRLLQAAADVLKRRFGVLAAGDLIAGLEGAAASIRAQGGIIKPAEPKKPCEGWGVIRPGDRRAHYYRDGMALCRRVGFYSGQLWPDLFPSPDDHKECRKLLADEKAKAAGSAR